LSTCLFSNKTKVFLSLSHEVSSLDTN